MIWLCLGGGLRIGEACSMPIGRVIAGEASVLIEKNLAKSDKSRRSYIMEQAMVYVRSYLATRPNAQPHEALFPSRSGKGNMTANWGSRLVKQLLLDAGITGASSQSFRRTHANNARRAGVDVLTIKEQLGHQHLNTTAEYLSVSDRERRTTVAQLRFGAEPTISTPA